MSQSSNTRIYVPQEESVKQRAERVRSELGELVVKLGIPQIVDIIYQRELSDEERHKLQPKLGSASLVKLVAELRSISIDRAIIDLARTANLIDDGRHRWLLRELGEPQSAIIEPSGRPVWDREAKELRYRGKVIRRIRSIPVAKNIVPILDAFESVRWRNNHITNLPAPLGDDDQKLREAVATLNEGLVTDDLRFESDGTGAGVIVRYETKN